MKDRKFQFVIVGSGAGGATVARELSQRGKEVLVLERGKFETKLGTFADAGRIYDVKSQLLPLPLTSKEGVIIWHTFQAGGSTVVSCGNGVVCLEKQLAERGVNVKAELDDVLLESKTAPIAESLLSPGSQALRDAAQSLGYRLDNMPKFINPEQCEQCGNCVFGCSHGAKWTMAKVINQAKHAAAEVLYDTKVENIVVEHGRAVGVDAIGAGGRQRIYADAVILAAGGLATPALLQRAGLPEAGQALFVDLLVNVYGVTKGLNLTKEPTMSLVDLEFHNDRGFLLSPFVNHSRRVRFAEAGLPGFMLPDDRLLGLMVKTRDDMVGRIYPDGTVSKPVTPADRKRLDDGAAVAKEILAKAGAEEKSFVVTKVQGGHPGGGAAIGTVVDKDMQTKLDGLFICDASALPETPGLPPILTIVALAKRLGKMLAA